MPRSTRLPNGQAPVDRLHLTAESVRTLADMAPSAFSGAAVCGFACFDPE